MRISRLIPLFVLAAACMPMQARAQNVKIATANAIRIFAEMKERKDVNAQLDDRDKEHAREVEQSRATIKSLIDQRAGMNPNHPQYRDLSVKIDKAEADFEGGERVYALDADRSHKLMLKALYEKIEAAIAQIAQQDKIDLVIADNRREIDNLEKNKYEALSAALAARTVLFANKNLDITDRVIAVLDAQYAAKGKK